MALLQRARRCGRARVRGNLLDETHRCYFELLVMGSVPFCCTGAATSSSLLLSLQSRVGLLEVLHLWAPMQDSGRLRLQSNSTMQARYC